MITVLRAQKYMHEKRVSGFGWIHFLLKKKTKSRIILLRLAQNVTKHVM